MTVISFDAFVRHGLKRADSIENGVPWRFAYEGCIATHCDDDTYLVTAVGGDVRFRRGQWLAVGLRGVYTFNRHGKEMENGIYILPYSEVVGNGLADDGTVVDGKPLAFALLGCVITANVGDKYCVSGRTAAVELSPGDLLVIADGVPSIGSIT